jgi:hypothetical protein
MGLFAQLQGLVSRALPNPRQPDTAYGNVRLNSYGDVVVQNQVSKKHGLAEEGSYFVLCNPTPGTAIASTVSATYDATLPYALMQNTANPGGARVYLDYIKLIPTVAAASGTTVYIAVVRDTLTAQVTTNHVTNFTPYAVGGDTDRASVAQWQIQNHATATVIGALSGNAKPIARGSIGGIMIVGDELVFDFGSVSPAAFPGLTAAQAVCQGRKVTSLPPVYCAPQQQLLIYLWYLNNAVTGPSFELEIGQWER